MNALVISGKVYVAWKRKMLHDVALHDVIGGHQAYILHVAKTTRGSRILLYYTLASREL